MQKYFFVWYLFCKVTIAKINIFLISQDNFLSQVNFQSQFLNFSKLLQCIIRIFHQISITIIRNQPETYFKVCHFYNHVFNESYRWVVTAGHTADKCLAITIKNGSQVNRLYWILIGICKLSSVYLPFFFFSHLRNWNNVQTGMICDSQAWFATRRLIELHRVVK